MKRRDHHHHHHHHYHKRHKRRAGNRVGFVKRTIRGLADKFGVSSKIIIFGFVLLFIFTGFFAMFVFFLAYLWVKNPGKLEDMIDSAVEKSRRGFDNMNRSPGFEETATAAGPSMSYGPDFSPDSSYDDHDFDFSELKQKFEDLEKRANDMEEHVSSDEYKLNKEFDDIK